MTRSTRACVQSLAPDPEDDRSDHPESAVGRSELVVASSDGAELFAASDEVLDQVTAAVDLAIEWSTAGLTPLVGDGVANAPATAVGTVASAGVGLFTHPAVGGQGR